MTARYYILENGSDQWRAVTAGEALHILRQLMTTADLMKTDYPGLWQSVALPMPALRQVHEGVVSPPAKADASWIEANTRAISQNDLPANSAPAAAAPYMPPFAL